MLNRSLKPLRIEKDLDQASIAKATGISQPTYSQLERSTKGLTNEQSEKLTPVLALGHRGEGEAEPIWAVAEVFAGRPVRLLVREDGRFGVFRDEEAALVIAGILRRIGDLQTYAVPLWISYVATEIARRGGGISKDHVLVVDDYADTLVRAEVAAAHAQELIRGWRAERDRTDTAAQVAANALRS